MRIRPSKDNNFKGKKYVQRKTVPPAPYCAEDPEFKFAAEFLRTGDMLTSARRYIPNRNETTLGSLVSTYKMQETLKFIAQLKADGFVISENQMDNMLAAMISFDPADAFEEDGLTVKNVHDMNIRTRAAIDMLETTRTMSGEITKIKFCNRQKALDLGMKRRNMFADHNKDKAIAINLNLASEQT